MPGLRYTLEELHALRQSPLVKKPDNLPNIEQWFEVQSQRQPRIQDQDAKQRGGTFEGRSTRYNPTAGEDVFLGPKMSFASASSAARQPRTTHSGANNITQEGEETRRSDRVFGGRARPDQDRSRRFGGDMNGDSDGRTRFGRARESVDADDDRSSRSKASQYGGEEGNGQPRRNGMGRGGKFDQPWLRGVNRDSQDVAAGEAKLEWRGSRPEHSREEDNGGWSMPTATQESMGTSSMMEDFQKWKERMKACKDPAEKAEEPTAPVSKQSEFETGSTIPDGGVQLGNSQKAFFGIYGADESDTPTPPPPSESTQTKSAVSKKAKASRFAKMFQPTEPSSGPAMEANSPQSPGPAAPPAEIPRSQSTNEDRAGFENMMRMLTSSRATGGPGQQANANALFSALSGQATSSEPQSNRSSLGQPPVPRGPEGIASPALSERPHPVPTPPSASISRPQTTSRDSEFLLNLMRSGQASRTPFTETQIYGQSYRRKGPEDTPPGLVGPSPPPPPRGNARVPPPGFFEVQQSLAGVSIGNLDPRLAHEAQIRNERQGPHVQEQGRREIETPSAKEAHVPGFPPIDQQFPPGLGFNGGRPPSPQRGGMPPGVPPPPGFNGPNRGAPPPGFQFPPGFPPHLAQQGPGRGPQMMSPQPGIGQGPPPFYGGPAPPGFAPPAQQHSQARPRPPSGGMPPGFDMYGAGMNGRGPMQPPPGQGGYAQYLKQMNGGAYQGL